ncbi:gamma-butyrobetaine hydroxylase-like domain-containing protein [Candidatus Odyssella acanthamoebae]|uniref:Gamma-butyrobetaine hydroxylase-like N-terminal domain-containing protein n=1 Tax=Candidatus Odyssella acanthamoebae TaxID=91604 RepID=A0A077AV62_9PROT|nr:DUF971 domain-containing protein [Candidatus Paracaedibacter acanthamoebae]AIK95518.1 hypothetical protein ID47_00215 [Candidatus Paracaedibacter acanthamoebae]
MSRSDFANKPWPTNIRLLQKENALEVEFDDGNHFSFSAEYLRVESPSAEVQGHGASQKRTLGGCKTVGIRTVESVGNYAIRIHFSDNHSTGIYSWSYLHELGCKKNENWSRYLEMVKTLGLSR